MTEAKPIWTEPVDLSVSDPYMTQDRWNRYIAQNTAWLLSASGEYYARVTWNAGVEGAASVALTANANNLIKFNQVEWDPYNLITLNTANNRISLADGKYRFELFVQLRSNLGAATGRVYYQNQNIYIAGTSSHFDNGSDSGDRHQALLHTVFDYNFSSNTQNHLQFYSYVSVGDLFLCQYGNSFDTDNEDENGHNFASLEIWKLPED